MPAACLVDTNVLLRASYPAMEQYLLCKGSVDRLHARGTTLHYTLQNAAEFWNVATRPQARNGYGRSPAQVWSAWQAIELSMTLLPDDERVHETWRALVQTHQVRGVQVHDARLAAAMLVHNVPHILTFNTADFARFSGVQAIHPEEV